jgi:hypothetical protein
VDPWSLDRPKNEQTRIPYGFGLSWPRFWNRFLFPPTWRVRQSKRIGLQNSLPLQALDVKQGCVYHWPLVNQLYNYNLYPITCPQ